MVTEALKVLIKMHNVDSRVLCGGSDCQVGKREAMSPMGAIGCQLAHDRENGALHAAIYGNLSHRVQGPLHCGKPVGSPRVDHELVAHWPAPVDITPLDCAQQQPTSSTVPASLHPGRCIRQRRAGAAPEPFG